MPNDRAQSAYRFRVEAAELARNRTHPKHEANGDEARYGSACYPMSFTKGLGHNYATGLVADAAHFEAFRSAIDNGFVEPFTTRVPVPRDKARRQWEAPTAGVVYELEGPDPQAVTMAPAPELCSDELTFEMAEVYELALLRDEPFYAFDAGGGSRELTESIERLNKLSYVKNEFRESNCGRAGRPRKTEIVDGKCEITRQTAFRGSSPGADAGPYLSQFMLIGSAGDPRDGKIAYGAQQIDQRVLRAKDHDDYMVSWDDWYEVQQGYKPNGDGQDFTGPPRFINTPRDLATYVHIDQLYQAYLNACLIMLGTGTPFDPAFALLSGNLDHELMVNTASDQSVPVNAGGFALWGGPHILSLVTEVATRGLKAVRFQKFNTHLRLRPEVLAARLEKASDIEAQHPSVCGAFSKMCSDLEHTLKAVNHHNKTKPIDGRDADTILLPMAFREGSPMHPTYGAGHATVAGACVTILKAFFDTSAIFVQVTEGKDVVAATFLNKSQIKDHLVAGRTVHAGAYSSKDKGNELDFEEYGEFTLHPEVCEDGEEQTVVHTSNPKRDCCPLNLEGELNKLAANISIGRNMAGVHYFSDYYDSARMGEEIALGILEEQALGYQTDRFVLSVPTFDGETVRIGRR